MLIIIIIIIIIIIVIIIIIIIIIIINIKKRWAGRVTSVCAIVIGKPGGKNHFEDLRLHLG